MIKPFQTALLATITLLFGSLVNVQAAILELSVPTNEVEVTTQVWGWRDSGGTQWGTKDPTEISLLDNVQVAAAYGNSSSVNGFTVAFIGNHVSSPPFTSVTFESQPGLTYQASDFSVGVWPAGLLGSGSQETTHYSITDPTGLSLWINFPGSPKVTFVGLPIFEGNHPPVLAPIGQKLVTEGQTLQFSVSAEDPDGNNLNFSISDLPPNANFDSTTQTFTWTPDYGDAGNYIVLFTVTDDGVPLMSDQESVTITVGDTNRPPILYSIGPKSVDEGQLLQFTIVGADPDEDNLTFSAGNLPDGASFDPVSRTLTWTTEFEDAGNYDLIFTVSDDGLPPLSDQETVTISVGNVNRPPVLNVIGSKSVDDGALLQFTVTGADPDSDDLFFSANNLPSGASFNDISQQFSWIPDHTQTGNYNDIEFIVTDNGNPVMLDVELITVTVNNVNRAPVFNPVGNQEVLENNMLEFSVSAIDLDGDNVALSADNLPGGAIFDSYMGQFSWAPDSNQAGNYTVVFHATDDGVPNLISDFGVTITVGEGLTPLELADHILDAIATLNLPNGAANPLINQLNAAKLHTEQGRISQAINKLIVFIDKVNEKIAEGSLNSADGEALIALANQMINVLNL